MRRKNVLQKGAVSTSFILLGPVIFSLCETALNAQPIAGSNDIEPKPTVKVVTGVLFASDNKQAVPYETITQPPSS